MRLYADQNVLGIDHIIQTLLNSLDQVQVPYCPHLEIFGDVCPCFYTSQFQVVVIPGNCPCSNTSQFQVIGNSR